MMRNFVYLDSEKLKSFSSQLFEGVTEQVVSHEKSSDSHSTDQKGPVSSGRMVGEIFAQERSSTQLKFLEDHAYTLFEDKLLEERQVCVIPDEDPVENRTKSFVKATARIRINDFQHSVKSFRQFNQMGEALWRVTNEKMAYFDDGGATKIVSDGEAKKKAAEIGLQLHQKVLESAAFLIEQNFGELLEINMNSGGWLISAPIRRHFLREPEALLVQKYSRTPQIEFTVLGLPAQFGDSIENPTEIPDVKDANNLRDAIQSISLHLGNIERNFGAPQAKELILDPIAIYAQV